MKPPEVAGSLRDRADEVTSRRRSNVLNGVIPAKAGTHLSTSAGFELGPCFRRDDTSWLMHAFPRLTP